MSVTPTEAQTPLSVTVCHTQDIGLIDPARGVLLNELNNLWVNMYETLVARDPGGRLVPNVAESWEVKSPTGVGVQDPPGITFHNGEPLNAQAVKATLDRYHEKDKQRYGAVAQGVKDVSVVDPYTVRITTPTPTRRSSSASSRYRSCHPATSRRSASRASSRSRSAAGRTAGWSG